MDGMKPCPFCGAPALVKAVKYPNGAICYEPGVDHDEDCILDPVIWCTDFIRQDEMIEAWNRRADDGMCRHDPA